MAKEPPQRKSPEKARSARQLTPALLQAKLERLDQALVKLFNERAELTARHGKLLQAAGEVAFLPGQEDAAIARAVGTSRGPLPAPCIQAVFRELTSGCRSLVRQPRVAFLGPLYSYSHLAAIHRFGQTIHLAPVGTIGAVFEEVHRHQSDFGLVPLENSTDGRIADTLDMFTRLPVRICGEVDLEIHHTLLARCPRPEVREVYSRPQALSQCRNWLAKHLPTAKTFEVTSTSTAAQLAHDKPGAAAIASTQAGLHYGLDVLAEQIEDNPGNKTRFAVIGHHPAPRTGRDRVALMFQVEHRPGGLADAINLFKRNRLNMTWIESFPIPGSNNRSYLFFVELEGHETDLRVRRTLATLQQRCLRLEVLGSFPTTHCDG